MDQSDSSVLQSKKGKDWSRHGSICYNNPENLKDKIGIKFYTQGEENELLWKQKLIQKFHEINLLHY